MSKKNKKKKQKKNRIKHQNQQPNKQHQKDKNPQQASSSKPETVIKSAPKSGIVLNEKIALEKSEHTYNNYWDRKYGKYMRGSKKTVGFVTKLVTIVLALFLVALAGLFTVYGSDLPDVRMLKTMNFSETTRIYDREGNVLYSIYGEENRKYVPLNEISTLAKQSTIAIEDKNFYNHGGFDLVGMIRAQVKNLQEESIRQGASTITQQLAKNIFLSPEKTYDRKIKELLLALQIEWTFNKDEILEMYLNKIAYGSNAYGIEAAAETFFGKTSSELNLVESAILASLPKAPSQFSPYGGNKKELMGYCQESITPVQHSTMELVDEIDLMGTQESVETNVSEILSDEAAPAHDELAPPDTASSQETLPEVSEPICSSPEDPRYVFGRKDYVLERMVEDGYITKAQMLEAWHEGFKVVFRDPVHKIEAPHFVFYVKELLEKKYGKEMVESGGLEVVTSLDPNLQSVAEDAVSKQAEHNKVYYNANNAGLVSVDPKTGQVLAMVGSVNYWNNEINGQVNVMTSFRQPGSSFKPFIYAAAIQNAGIGSGTVLGDYKTVFNKKDVPRNADGAYKGRMIVRYALAQSRNIPAIKAYYIAGEEEKILDFVDKLGLTSLREFRTEFNKDAEKRGWTFFYGWPMAIGSGEVRFLDMAGAYATFANQGRFHPVNPILEVRDRKGNVLEKFEPSEGEQVMDPQVAFIVANMMSDVGARPAGSWRNSLTIPGHTVAAKTGTSNKKIGRGIYPNNNVVIGYTPSIVSIVWVGNTDGAAMKGNAWAFADCGPIHQAFLQAALKDKPDEPFPIPADIKKVGSEYYPSFSKMKNDFDKLFKRVGSQEDGGKKKTDTKDAAATPVVKPNPVDAIGW
ncbi:penicillin-binding protein [Candidatus Peregrinibacteria bacterium]|nr:penicillin-binding protein [Candidatus Peregrinibacteria bacterium]